MIGYFYTNAINTRTEVREAAELRLTRFFKSIQQLTHNCTVFLDVP